jgi:hypothetical protein
VVQFKPVLSLLALPLLQLVGPCHRQVLLPVSQPPPPVVMHRKQELQLVPLLPLLVEACHRWVQLLAPRPLPPVQAHLRLALQLGLLSLLLVEVFLRLVLRLGLLSLLLVEVHLRQALQLALLSLLLVEVHLRQAPLHRRLSWPLVARQKKLQSPQLCFHQRPTRRPIRPQRVPPPPQMCVLKTGQTTKTKFVLKTGQTKLAQVARRYRATLLAV